jgi:glycerol-3-phosphate acyltransferase PlsX
MRIAIDAMGGDFAPRAVVEGALQAALEGGTEILLVGHRRRLEPELERLGDAGGRLVIEHAEEAVAMEEPAAAVRKKRDASVRVCARLVKEGRAQAMVTAGHTGATLIAAKTVIGTIPGVERPALAAVFPNRGGRTVILDVGANVGAKASHLREFAVMGHFYAQEIVGTPSPRVGLMSVGEEEGKGTDLTREVFRVLQTTGLNFIGNVEGRDVFRGTVDVIVCDGFVGNVLLKSCESLVDYLDVLLRDEMRHDLSARLGSLFARGAFSEFRRKIDWREYGAAPLLGIDGGCFIGHGSSTARAIKNAVHRAVEFVEAELHQKVRAKLAELHAQEEKLLGAAGAVSH